jgi:RNA-binding protein
MSQATSALQGYQRRHLRKLAHSLKPVVMIGEAGISSAVESALAAALEDHELVKVKLQGAENKKEIAAQLAKCSGAELCGLVGHTAILYLPNSEDPQIELPTRPL